MRITEFTRGDLITRIAPMPVNRYNDVLGKMEQVPGTDMSWLGTPLEFVGIENNCAYLRYKEKGALNGRVTKIPLPRMDDDNWAFFKLPEGVEFEELF